MEMPMHAMSLWSVRIAVGAALILAAASMVALFGRAPRGGPDLAVTVGSAFIGLALALRRGEAFAAWTLCGGCVVYAGLALRLGSGPFHAAAPGLLLGAFVWAGLQLQRHGVRVPWPETWARVALCLALVDVGIDVGWLLSDRPDAAQNLPALVFQMLLMGAMALGVWRRWPWAAYALVAWEALGVALTLRIPRQVVPHAVKLTLYVAAAYHVRKLAGARRAADPSRRRSLSERLSRRTTSR